MYFNVNLFLLIGAQGNSNDAIVSCTQHINKRIQAENIKAINFALWSR